MPTKIDPVVIRKYANRRLYNTGTSSYVTLEDLAEMVKRREDFVVQDAKSGEDITHSVLTQIIFELESRTGQNMLPISFLRELISFYGDQMQAILPRFLEQSMDAFSREQERIRQKMDHSLGGNSVDLFEMGFPMTRIEEQTRRNLEMFQDGVAMYASGSSSGPNGGKTRQRQSGNEDDLQELREQVAAMQRKLDALSPK